MVLTRYLRGAASNPSRLTRDRRDAEFYRAGAGAAVAGPALWAQAILFAILAFFLGAFVWANWAVLDEVTTGEGRVIPSSQIQVVQNLEGGILKEIPVHEGDIVDKGQILLVIEDTATGATLSDLEGKRASLAAGVSRLTAEVGGTPLQFPPDLEKKYPAIAQSERSLFQSRQAELQAQLAILHQQLDQRTQELVELKSKAKHLETSLQLAQQERNIDKPLVDQGVVPKIDFVRLERQINDLSSDLAAARLAIPRVEAAEREANRRIAEKTATFRASAQKDLIDRQTELASTSEKIVAVTDRVRRMEVRSPVKGVVKQIDIRTIGGVIRPGMDLVEIVPLDDTLLVEAHIRPKDIAFIRPGQEAVVKLTAYDFSVYGGLKAKVERISADTIVDEKAPRRGEPEAFYKVILRTDKNYLGTVDKPLRIIPGMVAIADILTGHKTVLQYLLGPIIKARNTALRER